MKVPTLNDADRRAIVRRARRLGPELERQARLGYDSLTRFADDYRQARFIMEMDVELRARRSHDADLARLAGVIRGFHERNSSAPTSATMDLVERVEKLLGGIER